MCQFWHILYATEDPQNILRNLRDGYILNLEKRNLESSSDVLTTYPVLFISLLRGQKYYIRKKTDREKAHYKQIAYVSSF